MEDQEKNEKDIFVELAKVKSAPAPLKMMEADTVGFAESDDAEGQLTVDVYQDGDAIVVQSTVAGVKPEDVEVSITPESVSVRGKRARSTAVEEKDYFYQECFWGSFSRSIILPYEVDPDKSTATIKEGVLTVKMPKLNRQKAKKVKVKGND
ncbi:MAG: Hsp20/alpha crystallin family protein [Candidatus Jorgensenbacteria bacterium]|nr:Hsp20/alpha crystallin family protein [Candidatus Jorgensenbacteria bacterium]